MPFDTTVSQPSPAGGGAAASVKTAVGVAPRRRSPQEEQGAKRQMLLKSSATIAALANMLEDKSGPPLEGKSTDGDAPGANQEDAEEAGERLRRRAEDDEADPEGKVPSDKKRWRRAASLGREEGSAQRSEG